MASIEAAIIQRLKANSGVAALVGTRIWPHEAREGAPTPYIVYYGTTEIEHHMGGKAGLASCELTLEVYADGAEGYSTVRSVTNAVRQCLDGYRGTINVTTPQLTVEAVDIRTCFCETHADAMAAPIDGSEKGRYVSVMQFSVGVLESSALGA